jgi:hypothetical protein
MKLLKDILWWSKFHIKINVNQKRLLSVKKGEFAIGTHVRFEISKKHVKDFMLYKYGAANMDFNELNFEFVKEYEFYLKTVKNNSNNTALKYITNFMKIVLIVMDREFLVADPFKRFKCKKIKVPKKPLTGFELALLEKHKFLTARLGVVRDVFVFQCYTGPAYIVMFLILNVSILKKVLTGNNGF